MWLHHLQQNSTSELTQPVRRDGKVINQIMQMQLKVTISERWESTKFDHSVVPYHCNLMIIFLYGYSMKQLSIYYLICTFMNANNPKRIRTYINYIRRALSIYILSFLVISNCFWFSWGRIHLIFILLRFPQNNFNLENHEKVINSHNRTCFFF